MDAFDGDLLSKLQTVSVSSMRERCQKSEGISSPNCLHLEKSMSSATQVSNTNLCSTKSRLFSQPPVSFVSVSFSGSVSAVDNSKKSRACDSTACMETTQKQYTSHPYFESTVLPSSLEHGMTADVKKEAARIKKHRRRSAFGAELQLRPCALQVASDDDNLPLPSVIQEFSFMAKDAVNCSLPVSSFPCAFSSATRVDIKNKQVVIENTKEVGTGRRNDGPLVSEQVQPSLAKHTNEVGTGRRNDGPLVSEQVQPSLAKHTNEVGTGRRDDDPSVSEQVQPSLAKHKKKRRMSADISVMMDSNLIDSSCLIFESIDSSSDCVPDKAAFKKRRSSLRLYRRSSKRISASCPNNEETESSMSELPTVHENRDAEPLKQKCNDSSSGLDAEDSDITLISPELEKLYRNKIYKKPADRMWETIFEFPSKGKVTSKRKFRRWIHFTDNVPMFRLKRRLKKASQNGWNASTGKLAHVHEKVRQKLMQLDETLS